MNSHRRLVEHCEFAGFSVPTAEEAAAALSSLQNLLSKPRTELLTADGDSAFEGKAAWAVPSADYHTYGAASSSLPHAGAVKEPRDGQLAFAEHLGAAESDIPRSSAHISNGASGVLAADRRESPPIRIADFVRGNTANAGVGEPLQCWLAARFTVQELYSAQLFK